MKSSDNHIDRAWAEDRIEAYVDGDLSGKEKKAFEHLVRQDVDLAREVALEQRLKRALGELPKPVCPPTAYEPVLDRVRREAPARRIVRQSRWLREQVVLIPVPVRVILAAVTVIAVATVALLPDRVGVAPAHDPTEVQAALEEVKRALSYVSLAGRETGSAIRTHAVDQTLIRPIRRAIGRAGIGSDEQDPTAGEAPETANTTRGKS